MRDAPSVVRESTTPWSKPIMVLIVTQIILGMREIPQSAFFLVYLQTAKLSPVTIATMTSTAQISGMIAALVGGMLTTRYGHKWVFVIGLLVTALNSLVFHLDNMWVIAVLWALGGAGSAVANIGSSSYLTALGSQSAMGVISAMFVLSTTIGGTLGNPLVGYLIAHYGYTVFGWIMLMVILVMSMVVTTQLAAGVHQHVATPTMPVLPPRQFVRMPAVRAIIMMRAGATMCYGMVLVLVPLILHAMTADVTVVATYTSLTLVAASLVQFLVGQAADRWGARSPTVAMFAVMVVCGIVLGILPQTTTLLMVCGVTTIACAWALSALMFVWIRDGVPAHYHPPLFGMLYAVWSISMIIGSIVGSWLYEQWSGAPFLVFGLLNIAPCLIVVRFYASLPTTQESI